MRFAPQFLDEIKARIPVSRIVGRKVLLKKKGHEFWGLSPFKTEKTPSFSVNDIKGFYHCFATQEHGDIFTFLIKTEGLSFLEAVERLALEAGVKLFNGLYNSEADRECEYRRLALLMTEAANFFKKQLYTEFGGQARDYLAKRQLDDDVISKFELGYAPNDRYKLKTHLSNKGFSEFDMIRSGMLVGGSDIRQSYDRFRNRVIFPIHDFKGQVVAFGGRALRAEAPAKYLNSPETPLFRKRHLLYNAHRARESAFRKHELITVEGYMDVIALSRVNILQTVAPLGTSLTKEQLQLMWRIAPEPIMCFDGDQAGHRAAYRALDVAFPILKPGRSLRFIFLSDGLDPDDVIRQRGVETMRSLIDLAKPLEEVLWQREWEADIWSTPERKAALDARFNILIEQIADTGVKSHYRWAIKQRLHDAWRFNSFSKPQKKVSFGYEHTPQRSTYASKRRSREIQNSIFELPERAKSLEGNSLVTGHGQNYKREASLIRALINHPWLLFDFAETIAELKFFAPRHQRLCDCLLSLLTDEVELDTPIIIKHLSESCLEKDLESVMCSVDHNCDRFAEFGASKSVVTDGWKAELVAHKLRMLRSQIENAEQESLILCDENVYQRILELKKLEIATKLEVSEFER